MSKRILAISDGSDVYSRDRKSRSPEHVPRKRKSRWSSASESERTYIPGMPTQLPPNLTPKQEKAYILQLQIEDISRRLKSGDLGIPKNPEDRSPSPEPIYSSDGKRLNTREYRTRKKMEDDRHSLIQQMIELNPDYKPPSEYKPPQNRITDKVFIPQEDHPDINFVGLLIGPRGNTLKALEKETGAKVIIRGKGSVKEGKVGRRDGLPMPGEDEPLHAFISAPIAEAVEKAVRKINEIIRQGIEVPESQNDLRRAQLRELALLNGTLREHEGLMKLRAMAEAQTIATNKIQCGICGGAGHLSQDCKANLSALGYMDQLNANPSERAKMDSEYSALMAELGVGGGSNPFHSGLGRGMRPQASRPPRQPPPPGVAPTEDDEDDVATTAVNGTATSTAPAAAAVPNPYPFALPPPPPVPPSNYPPVMPPMGSWPGMIPPVAAYPAGSNYPAMPSGTGVFTAPATTGSASNNSAGTAPWQTSSTSHSGWGDAGNTSYTAPGMVPPPYMPAPMNYWAAYPQPVPNPPPPPPPGV